MALAACSTKTQEAAETAADESTETAVLAPANGDTVIELDDAAKLAPGVKVSRLTVIDFNAVWCGPCRELAPVLEVMAKKYAGKVDFYSIDVDRFGQLFVDYNVGDAIPAVVFLMPDGTTTNYVGTGDLLPAEKFEAIIESKLN